MEPHADSPVESAPNVTGQSIFDFDIACPKCGYNLRGLVERRCPECGSTFSPRHVLEEYHQRRRTRPIWWLIRNVHLHPQGFWPEVMDTWGPTALQVLSIAGLGAGSAWIASIFGLVVATATGEVPLGALPEGTLLVGLSLGLIVGAASLLLVGHRVLVNLILLGRSQEPWIDAWLIVGYPAAWLVTISPVAAGAFFAAVETGGPASAPASSVPSVARVMGLFFGLLLLALLGLWSLTIYSGGRRMSQGSHVRGALCALANPFLWLLGWAGLAVLSAAM